MNARRIGTPLVATFCTVLLLLVLSQCLDAATYRVPVSTATLIASQENWDRVGEPGVPYELQINPATLRFGYDIPSGLVYESAIIFSWDDLAMIPADTGSLALHLPSISVVDESHCYIQDISVEHAAPEATDFDWWSGGSGVMVLWAFDPSIADLPVFGEGLKSLRGKAGQYSGWVLTTAFMGSGVNEMAGIGNGSDGTYMLVTAVPEPSSLIGLGSGLSLLGRLIALTRRTYPA